MTDHGGAHIGDTSHCAHHVAAVAFCSCCCCTRCNKSQSRRDLPMTMRVEAESNAGPPVVVPIVCCC